MWHHSIRIRVQLLRRGIVSSVYLYTLDSGRESTGGHHRKLSTEQSHTRDKENIAVQFVIVTPKDMLTFETLIFISRVPVTLEGTSVMDIYQFFFKQLKSCCFFLSSHNGTRVKCEHIRLMLKVISSHRRSQWARMRGVSLLCKYLKAEREKQMLWTRGQIDPLGVLRAKSGP